MPDREPTLAEIEAALEAATPGPWAPVVADSDDEVWSWW